jgi:hypothetical protein
VLTDQSYFDTSLRQRRGNGKPDKAASDHYYFAAQIARSFCLLS